MAKNAMSYCIDVMEHLRNIGSMDKVETAVLVRVIRMRVGVNVVSKYKRLLEEFGFVVPLDDGNSYALHHERVGEWGK